MNVKELAKSKIEDGLDIFLWSKSHLARASNLEIVSRAFDDLSELSPDSQAEIVLSTESQYILGPPFHRPCQHAGDASLG